MIYTESSVLTSLVMPDSNSGRALELMAGIRSPLLFNHLLRLEVCNAIRLNVVAGGMDEEDAVNCARQAEEMELSGKWVMVEPDWERVFQRSIEFSRTHTSSLRTRSFDILHVAAAVELGATEFWSFDKRQRALALEVGLRINP